MSRVIVALVMAGMLLLASPAAAIHKGRVCKIFSGPDGRGGAQLTACLVVDDHDFEDKIRGMVVFTNTGNAKVELHASYLRLIRGTTTVRDTGPWTGPLGDGLTLAIPTLWLNNPNGTYHSRIRAWFCWPTFAGDPCGSINVWNSGYVTY